MNANTQNKISAKRSSRQLLVELMSLVSEGQDLTPVELEDRPP